MNRVQQQRVPTSARFQRLRLCPRRSLYAAERRFEDRRDHRRLAGGRRPRQPTGCPGNRPMISTPDSDRMDSSDQSGGHDLAVRMAELARVIAAPRTLEQILDDVTAAAVELIPGADVSGILLVKKGGRIRIRSGHRRLSREARQTAARFRRRALRAGRSWGNDCAER
jgi:hypothetical protein